MSKYDPLYRWLVAKSASGVTSIPTTFDQIEVVLRDAFARGPGHGPLQLGAGEAGTAIPAVFSYWREFSARYVTRLCSEPDLADASAKGLITPPADAELDSLVLSVPPMTGAEYLTRIATTGRGIVPVAIADRRDLHSRWPLSRLQSRTRTGVSHPGDGADVLLRGRAGDRCILPVPHLAWLRMGSI